VLKPANALLWHENVSAGWTAGLKPAAGIPEGGDAWRPAPFERLRIIAFVTSFSSRAIGRSRKKVVPRNPPAATMIM